MVDVCYYQWADARLRREISANEANDLAGRELYLLRCKGMIKPKNKMP
jgi:hypothetical protein